MRLSIYTKIKNGLHFDYHTVHMLRHHAQYVDEIVVNEGHSTDGTFEAIQGIDPKIRIIRSDWDFLAQGEQRASAKNLAREQCTGDWCILLDSDEFIPEWEFPKLRALLETTQEPILPVHFLHFYGNYRVCLNLHRTKKTPPPYGFRIHRNDPAIAAWGDASNVCFKGQKPPPPPTAGVVEVHHFGEVRNPARLRQKWHLQAKRHGRARRWLPVPSFAFRLFPHRWLRPDIMPHLSLYEGPVMQIVEHDPSEFVRDNWKTYQHLLRQKQE